MAIIYGTNGDDFGQLGTADDDVFYGLDGDDTWFGNKGNDILYGGNGNDTLSGGYGNNFIYGESGNDVLHSSCDGDDTLDGGEGDDSIYCNTGNNIVIGGKGNDRIFNQWGNNTIIFGRGDGHDSIHNITPAANGNKSVIQFKPGITRDDIEIFGALGTKGGSFFVRIKDTGDSITASVYNDQQISITFDDGTGISWNELLRLPITSLPDPNASDVLNGTGGDDTLYGYGGNDTLNGHGGNDKLYGGDGNDILNGGAGNDQLYGGAGDDTYIFNRGDGHDIIYEDENRAGKRNVIKLGDGIGINDIEFLTVLNSIENDNPYMDLVIRIKDTGETITVNKGISHTQSNTNNPYSIQAIELADGTVLEWSDIMGMPITPVDGNDQDIYLDKDGANFVGSGAADVVYGSSGSDSIAGGAGADQLHGGAGNDTLYGGVGDDTLYGGDGNDAYLFGHGDGNDVIHENENRSGKRDIIKLGNGISLNDIELLYAVNADDSAFKDLIIRLKSSGETLTITKGLSDSLDNADNPHSIQAIELADGTVLEWSDISSMPINPIDGSGDEPIYGTDNADIITGTDGDDSIYGLGGNDVLFGGNGNDTLDGGDGNDTLYGEDGDDTLIGGIGTDVLHGGAGSDILYGDNGKDTLYGGTGDDILYGGNGQDKLYGGAGNDSLYGEDGDDAYFFGRGDGHDTIYENESRAGKRDIVKLGDGIGLADIEFLTVLNSNDNNNPYMDLIIRIKDTGETLTIDKGISHLLNNADNAHSIQAVEFADGTVLQWSDIMNMPIRPVDGNSQDIYASADGSILTGTDSLDRIFGGAGADTLSGGIGPDELHGGGGNDTLHGDNGHDKLYGGDGDDTIYGGNGNDLIHGDSGDDHLYGEVGNDTIYGGDGNDTIYGGQDNDIIYGDAGDDMLYGGLGNDELHGGAGNDYLQGGAGDDILHGGAGDDILNGGEGKDIYHFGIGDGQDTITEQGGKDTLIFGYGLSASDLWFERSGNDLVIDVLGSADKMTITSWYANDNSKVESITAGGLELTSLKVDQLIQAMASFGVPQGVDGKWQEEQKDALQPILASYWKTA